MSNNCDEFDETSLDRWIDDNAERLISVTRGLLRIPSVRSEPAEGAPFGVQPLAALDYALDAACSLGLTAKNLEGYAGHAEWVAAGVKPDAPTIGLLAHLDVVPEGVGWTHAPYGAEIVDGILYGRGAIDDKGPAMAGLFAAAAIAAVGCPLTHRIRVIFGCDEETGFECVEHYFANEQMPAAGFTPDGEFPLIYAEKGIVTCNLSGSFPSSGAPVTVSRLQGGRRSNMVPDRAIAELRGDPGTLSQISGRIAEMVDVAIVSQDDCRIEVEAHGVSAHGSTPECGRNAVAILAGALLKLGQLDHEQSRMLVTVRNIGLDTRGESMGIAGSDALSILTTNLGIASFTDGLLSLTVNVRYPVTWELSTLMERFETGVAEAGLSAAVKDFMDPLYVPLDDPLIQTLLQVYRETTGDNTEPKVIGGGTYARAMRTGVAFGAAFAGRGGKAHEADENWPVADLILATKIFARALFRLARQTENGE